MTNPKKSLVAKLAEILGEMGQMQKEGKNVSQNYDYFTEGQVMAQLRQKLSSRGVWIKTAVINHARWDITTAKGSVLQFVSVETKHTFIDAKSGEREECEGFGIGMDSGDKAGNKAITAAVKYMLMKSFFVSDAADPENDANFPPQSEPEKQQEPPPLKPERHKPTTAYEEKTAEQTPSAMEDIAYLREVMSDNWIDDEIFIIEIARRANQCGKDETRLEQLKPGVLAKLVQHKDVIIRQWNAKTNASAPPEPPIPPGNANPAGGQSKSPPVGNAGKREYNLDGGDRGQKRWKQSTRQPCQDDISPEDLLQQEGIHWPDVKVHFGKNNGKRLQDLTEAQLRFYVEKWAPKAFRGKISENDILLDAALCVASAQ